MQVLYIHGKGGTAEESEHYQPLFPMLVLAGWIIRPFPRGIPAGKSEQQLSSWHFSMIGFGALCFEGNIGFYGKCGFDYASNFGIRYHGLPGGADASLRMLASE